MYNRQHTIHTNVGNNTFSFHERVSRLGKAEIIIPYQQTVSSVDEVELGEHVVFEELDHSGNLKQCTGLQHIYELVIHPANIYIFDNHNHALYFRGKHRQQTKQVLPVIHIDQHSDLAQPLDTFDVTKKENEQYLREYTNFVCNVGNFINPALTAGYISSCMQVRSESTLLELHTPHSSPVTTNSSLLTSHYILDIDLDFRAPEMPNEKMEETIALTRQLITNASLVTIATSPYFLDQKLAIQLLYKLLT